MHDFDHDTSADIQQPMGACLVMRRRQFLELGGFDARLSLFFNDVDLCRRWRRRGLRAHYLADAKVMHHCGRSTQKLGRSRVLWAKNSLVYYQKHYGWLGWLVGRATLGLWAIEYGCRVALSPRSLSHKRNELRALRQHVRDVFTPEPA
jgi:hypothetical protein